MEVLYAIKTWLVWGAVVAFVLMFFVAITWNQIRDAYARANPWSRGVFFVAVAGITLYGGSKHINPKFQRVLMLRIAVPTLFHAGFRVGAVEIPAPLTGYGADSSKGRLRPAG